MTAGRPPRGWREKLTANTRPQPAIPAALVFMLTLSAGLFGGVDGWAVWLVPLGLLASCGLAVAAGFCSLFPPLLWLLLAVWALSLVGRGTLPPSAAYAVYIGAGVSVTMLVVQLWRIRTKRFVPTITEFDDTAE